MKLGSTGNYRRSTCLKGHPLVGDNVRLRLRNGREERSCRICQRDRGRVLNKRVASPQRLALLLARLLAEGAHAQQCLGEPCRCPLGPLYAEAREILMLRQSESAATADGG